MSDQLPFAPLTHHELNQRHDTAIKSAGYYLGACRKGGRLTITDLDEQALLADLDDATAYLDAAKLRLIRGAA